MNVFYELLCGEQPKKTTLQLGNEGNRESIFTPSSQLWLPRLPWSHCKPSNSEAIKISRIHQPSPAHGYGCSDRAMGTYKFFFPKIDSHLPKGVGTPANGVKDGEDGDSERHCRYFPAVPIRCRISIETSWSGIKRNTLQLSFFRRERPGAAIGSTISERIEARLHSWFLYHQKYLSGFRFCRFLWYFFSGGRNEVFDFVFEKQQKPERNFYRSCSSLFFFASNFHFEHCMGKVFSNFQHVANTLQWFCFCSTFLPFIHTCSRLLQLRSWIFIKKYGSPTHPALIFITVHFNYCKGCKLLASSTQLERHSEPKSKRGHYLSGSVCLRWLMNESLHLPWWMMFAVQCAAKRHILICKSISHNFNRVAVQIYSHKDVRLHRV